MSDSAMETTKQIRRQHSLLLFLWVAFPIHFWSILTQLYQLQDITFGEIIGRAGYALLFALVESCLLFLLVWLVYYLLGRLLAARTALALSGWLYLMIALARMAVQGYAMLNKSGAALWLRLLGAVCRSGMVGLVAVVLFILALVLLPSLSFLRSGKAVDVFFSVAERLALLSSLYLVLDAAGLLVVLIRNLVGAA